MRARHEKENVIMKAWGILGRRMLHLEIIKMTKKRQRREKEMMKIMCLSDDGRANAYKRLDCPIA